MFVTRKVLEKYLLGNKSIFNKERRVGYVGYCDEDSTLFTDITIYSPQDSEGKSYKFQCQNNSLVLEFPRTGKQFLVESYEDECLIEKIDLVEDFISFETKRLFIDPDLAREMDPSVNLKHELYKVIVEYNRDPFFLCHFLTSQKEVVL